MWSVADPRLVDISEGQIAVTDEQDTQAIYFRVASSFEEGLEMVRNGYPSVEYVRNTSYKFDERY